MKETSKRTVWTLVALAAGLLALGTTGFMVYEHESFGNALYTTVILLLTHFDDRSVTDTPSRIIVLILIVSSLGLIAYLLKWLAEYMMGLSSNVRRLRVKAKVEKLSGHYIVCGLGRVGAQIAREMKHEGVAFVALDRDNAKVEAVAGEGYLSLALDSTDEAALHQAGIDRAIGLVACLGEDSANLLVTLAARSLNPNLYIVARANRSENEVKLKRAGANRVAMPYQIGGYHMASMALRPNVVDYMDVVSSPNGTNDLEVEEMVVGENSKLAGHSLGKSLAEGQVGATVIAINGADGTSRVRPTGQERIYPGDRLIILGSKHDLTAASELIR
ncbi:TrkA family potassium uptake protein [Candidatus Saccharibacteria bacterium]|nr:TrkA family potassium uptake protein [Candidatus Saccharibacteria bacterium]